MRDPRGFDGMMSPTNSAFSDLASQASDRYRNQAPQNEDAGYLFDMQVFISAGMPEGVLRHLFKQALDYPPGRIRFVVRGFEPQKLGALIGRLRKLFPNPEQDQIVVEIDPNAFRHYGVEAVPVFLVKNQNKWYEVRGAISLAGAKENVRKKGPLVMGEMYDIAEPDVLAIIEDRARNFDWKPVLDRAQKRATAKLAPSFDLPTVTKNEVVSFVPSFTVPQDIVIPVYNGAPEKVVAKAGQRFNVLDFTRLQAPIIVIDATDKRQVRMVKEWIAGPYRNADIFVVGSSIHTKDKPAQVALAEDLMRPVYPWFGRMTDRFGVRAVPAVVEQSGDHLKINYVEPRGF